MSAKHASRWTHIQTSYFIHSWKENFNVKWLVYQLKSEEIAIRTNEQDLQLIQSADSSNIIAIASILNILLIRTGCSWLTYIIILMRHIWLNKLRK